MITLCLFFIIMFLICGGESLCNFFFFFIYIVKFEMEKEVWWD